MKVPVVENVLKLNDEVAAMNRQMFQEADLFVVDLIGAPGSGKTALLEATLRRLTKEVPTAVLVGDLATARDAERLARHCDRVVQINTGKGCHLDANQVRQAAAQIDLSGLKLLVIENVGNLICPVGFDLGQDAKVGMFSTTEGDDKAAKHPHLVHAAELIILNKIDLLPHVPFDMDAFSQDIEQLHPGLDMVKTSATTDEIDPWIDWLTARIAARTG